MYFEKYQGLKEVFGYYYSQINDEMMAFYRAKIG